MDGSTTSRMKRTKSRRRSLRTLQLLDSSPNQTASNVLPQNYGSVWVNYDTLSPNPKCSRRSISRRSICESFAKNSDIKYSDKENVYLNLTSVKCAASPTTSSCNIPISNSPVTNSIKNKDIANSECYNEAPVPQECLVKVISAMCIGDSSKYCHKKPYLHPGLLTPNNSQDNNNYQFSEEFVSNLKKFEINNSYLASNDLSTADSDSYFKDKRPEKYVLKENSIKLQSPAAIESDSLTLTESLPHKNNLTDSLLSCQNSSSNLSSIENDRAEVSDTYFNAFKENSLFLEDLADNGVEMNYSSKRDILNGNTSELSESYSYVITSKSKNQKNSFNSSGCSNLSMSTSSLSELTPVSSDSWHFMKEYPDGYNKKDVNMLSDSTLLNTSFESELSDSWCFTSLNTLNKLPRSSIYQCSTPCRASETLPANNMPDIIRKEYALPQSASESPLTSRDQLLNISGILKGIFVKDVSPVQALSKAPFYLGRNEQNYKTISSSPSISDDMENVSEMQEECILSFRKELSGSSDGEANLMIPGSQQIRNRGLESLMNNLNLTSNSISKETSPEASLEAQKKISTASLGSSDTSVPDSKPKAKKSKSKVLESRSADSEVALAKRKKLRRRALNIHPIELNLVNDEPIKDFDVVHMECFHETATSLECKPAEEKTKHRPISKVKQQRTRKSSGNSCKPAKDCDVVQMECCHETATPLEFNLAEKNPKSLPISKVKQQITRKSAGNSSKRTKDFDLVQMECYHETATPLKFNPAEEKKKSLPISKVKQQITRKSAGNSSKRTKDFDLVQMECYHETATPLEFNPAEEKKESLPISKVKQRITRKSIDNCKQTTLKTKGVKLKSVQNNKDLSGEKQNVKITSSVEGSNTTPFRRCSKRKSIEVSLMLNKKEADLKVVADEENADALKEFYLQKNYKPIKTMQLETIYDCPMKEGPNALFSKKRISRTLSFETNPIKLKNRRKKALKNWPFLFEVLDAADKRQIMFCNED